MRKSFSGMMSSIFTWRKAWRGRAAGSVLATSAFEAVRARATMRTASLLFNLRAAVGSNRL